MSRTIVWLYAPRCWKSSRTSAQYEFIVELFLAFARSLPFSSRLPLLLFGADWSSW